MKTRWLAMPDDERGGTLVLVAFSLFLLVGMAALAVDIAAAFAWRAEAQKIADSSALAGGSAFLDMPATVAAQPAQDRAYAYALQHTIKGDAVDSTEVTVQVITDSMKVRVGVNRPGMPVWFARILGMSSVDIGAVAAAQATASGAARCLKPIALPDAWYDADQDENGDNAWNPGEEWELGSDPLDNYQPYEGPGTENSSTGYGSDLRDPNGDWGRFLQIKSGDPQNEYQAAPGIFYPWRLPPDPNQAECEQGGGGANDAGGATFRRNLCSCNKSLIELGQPYDLEPGNMIGPTYQGVDELIDSDPDAYWEPSANGGKGGVARPDANSPGGFAEVGMGSPRVVKIALFDPAQITGSGMQSITFNNFALMFLEDMPSAQSDVSARFMYFVSGEGDAGPTNGSLVRFLRLVE